MSRLPRPVIVGRVEVTMSKIAGSFFVRFPNARQESKGVFSKSEHSPTQPDYRVGVTLVDVAKRPGEVQPQLATA